MSSGWKPSQSCLDAGKERIARDDVDLETAIIMSRLDFDQTTTNPVVLPIYNTSTYLTQSVDEYLDILKTSGYIYSRLGNPNCQQVEVVVNTMEGGAGSIAFVSGMAAITTSILAVCKAGDHIICQNPIYSGTHKFLTKYCPNYGFEYSFVDAGCDVEEYRKQVRKNTKLLIGETPCNPNISILDVEAFGKLGHELGVCTMVDTTYASPYLIQPAKYGVDITVHSATKYLGGHSDVVAGVVTTSTLELWKEINVLRTTLGNTLNPMDAFILNRGMRTLSLRMEKHCNNAMSVAEYLNQHPKVEKVYYPGLKSHPGHEIAKRQMKDNMFGGMISFEIKGGLEAARRCIENVHVIRLSVSLGAVESLVEHAATMTHGPMIMSSEERLAAGITDGLIRLSVGLESSKDLIADLGQALEKA